MKLKTINVKAIRIDGGTQSRVEIHNETVADYADAIKSAAKFPPMVVFHDGADYWLADGFHRWHAFNKAGKASAEADVRSGSLRDAVLFSLGANGTHGLRRTNADKRKAVESMLADAEWSEWSDHKIAETCGVSHPFVAAVRSPKAAARQEENRQASSQKKAAAVESDSSADEPKQPARVESDSKKSAAPVESDSSAPADDGPDAAELAANAMAMKADADALQKLLDSDDKLATAHAEIKRLNAELAIVKLARDGWMNKANEAIKSVKRLQSRLDKLERTAA